MNPKVSVIMPTCKRAHFLSRAIDSVLSQTYENIEVVVVDDNANDEESRNATQQLMENYKDDNRVIYIQNATNLGGGISRNAGITACNGEYITFLDDDDIYLPPKVEGQLKFMLMHSLDVSFTDVHLCDGEGNLVEHRTRRFIKSWDVDHLMRMHILYSIGPTSTFMMTKELLLKMGGFRSIPGGQDFMLMWDVLKYAEESDVKIGYLPESHIKQFLHDERRISLGSNKIFGEGNLYKVKCTQKHRLTAKECKYVDFRHHSVLAVTCKRSGMTKEAIKQLFIAFNISPYFTVKEGTALLKKRNF